MTPEESHIVEEQTAAPAELIDDQLPAAEHTNPETIWERITNNPRLKALALIGTTFGVPILMSVLGCRQPYYDNYNNLLTPQPTQQTAIDNQVVNDQTQVSVEFPTPTPNTSGDGFLRRSVVLPDNSVSAPVPGQP